MAKAEDLDLLKDEYWIVGWPDYTLHSSSFPYLVHQLAGGIYAPTKVPDNLADKLAILEWARAEEAKYQFPVCLVLSPKHAYYINRPDKIEESTVPAMGGMIVNWEKFKLGEIRQGDTESGGKLIWTDNPNSQIPGVYSTGERYEVMGLDPQVKAN